MVLRLFPHLCKASVQVFAELWPLLSKKTGAMHKYFILQKYFIFT